MCKWYACTTYAVIIWHDSGMCNIVNTSVQGRCGRLRTESDDKRAHIHTHIVANRAHSARTSAALLRRRRRSDGSSGAASALQPTRRVRRWCLGNEPGQALMHYVMRSHRFSAAARHRRYGGLRLAAPRLTRTSRFAALRARRVPACDRRAFGHHTRAAAVLQAEEEEHVTAKLAVAAAATAIVARPGMSDVASSAPDLHGGPDGKNANAMPSAGAIPWFRDMATARTPQGTMRAKRRKDTTQRAMVALRNCTPSQCSASA